MLPTWNFEQDKWNKGFKFVAGADEVGRGCFAGPVVAAACVFPINSNFQSQIVGGVSEKIIINDSKKLNFRQRMRSEKWIKQNALGWGVGEASNLLINKYGLTKASNIAFRRALAVLNMVLGRTSDFLLVDAFFIPYVKGIQKNKQQPIIKGDAKSFSIAAASIIAKVHRDKLMTYWGRNKKYKNYGWEKNKGYGTKYHQQAILKHGVTTFHRKAFVSTFLSKNKNLTIKSEVNNSFSFQAR